MRSQPSNLIISTDVAVEWLIDSVIFRPGKAAGDVMIIIKVSLTTYYVLGALVQCLSN
jgi:hypothetical protein